MVALSVNVNKVATLRNSRGGHAPSLLQAVDVAIAAGAHGITVHPRADERHITRDDLFEVVRHVRATAPHIELNVEGDPRPDLLEAVWALRPDQLTLVPVRPGEITSEAGWGDDAPMEALAQVIARARGLGIRTSVFVEATASAVDFAARLGAARVELYTKPWADAFGHAEQDAALARFAAAAARAGQLGLGVNAGHDLDVPNLPAFVAAVRPLDEVSIGHAIFSRALFDGLAPVVRAFLDAIATPGSRGSGDARIG